MENKNELDRLAVEQEKLWQEIIKNDDSFRKLKDFGEHPYITKAYFQQVFAKYSECKDYLSKCQKAIPKTDRDEPLSSSSQTKRLKIQEFRVEQLRDLFTEIQSELELDKGEYLYRHLMEQVNKQWHAIQKLHEEILSDEEDHEDKYFTESVFAEVGRQYKQVIADLSIKLQQIVMAPSQQVSVNQFQQHPPLPKVQIPIFSGGYENWPTFCDVFKRTIHENSALTRTDKINYLKTHTRGEASKLIQHLETIATNYDSAWDLLQRRYENKRLLIFKLLDKLLDLPEISRENSQKLRQMHDVINECLQALKNLDVDVSTWGPMITRIIIRKWDSETNRLYEQSLDKPHDIPDLTEIMKFLERRFQSLETIPGTERQSSPEIKHGPSRCLFCEDQHIIYYCRKFKELSAQERNRYVQEKRICYNCLKHDNNKKCHSMSKCSICSRQHHTLLHMDRNQQNSPRQQNNQGRTSFTQRNYPQNAPPRRTEHYPTRSNTTNHTSKSEENVLLATALVEVTTSSSPQVMRILIDQGSQISIITEEAANRIGLPRRHIRSEISGVGDGKPQVSKWSIDAHIKPRFASAFSMEVNMIVLPRLTQFMPMQQLHISSIDSWKNEVLADPTFMTPGAIDGIFGAKEYASIMMNGLQKTTEGLLKQNTELGWIVSGPITSGSPAIQIVSMITHVEEDKQLTKFWEIEEMPDSVQLTKEEQECEEFYEKTTTRDSDGRFVVKIPFKQPTDVLGHSKPRAAARLINVERKLHQNSSLREEYSGFMREYLELGHMRKVNRQEVNQGQYYIPHQAVIRESSTTTRLRVVFDASCKSSTSISLNDIMHVGPRLQQNIADILLRWRKHEIVFCADIEKMYRQIRIHPDDQQFQRIVWREQPRQPMFEYELTTVTYGTASAPYLAIKTLQKLAIEEANKFPAASQVALTDFYVDDILSGAHNTETALELQRQLLEMLTSAGFNLRKWSSNSPVLLQSIPEQFRDQKVQELPQDDFKKSLGVLWSPVDETFKFQVNISKINRLTKRQILSEISKLFDPLGWISPIVIQAKLIIQDLWLKNREWDETVDEEIASRWTRFQDKIMEVEKIKIPRWIHQRDRKVELHGFCDASEKAYGAVIYSRTVEEGNQVITLLQAKSKVAPAKNRTTLPRLELCAAVLLSKLIQRTKKTLQLEDTETFAWTDSMITLAWIKGNPTRWQTFVANRVCEIHRNTPYTAWNHVKSQDNPADIISRGVDPDKLQSAELWWKGPSWLNSLGELPTTHDIPDVQAEVRATCLKTEVTARTDICEQFSDLTRMLRVLSYCRRFVKKGEKPALSVQEIQTTFETIIKTVQQQEFPEEYKSLQQNKPIDKRSKLLTLCPFIDSKGVIRVGGRLENSSLPYDQRHPMILPYHTQLTTLIVRDAHKKTLHGGNQVTLSYIRSQFWIINGKRAVKTVINKCIVCIRHKAETAQQLMGQLPKPRVTPAPPFSNSGVDYAGPIQVRATKGRGHKSYKGYIAVFVCLATKAIHLEVVSDMTTEAFVAAFRRFTARRGHCAHMYSDNGTTFVGAARQFEDEITKVVQDQSLQSTIVNLGTQWHFIPPAAPHFGGVWEAGVKSMKHHFKRIIGDCTLTYEELTTLMHQIEACLNSRPLCPLTEDSEDFSALTPGHFLIGRELLAPPDLKSTENFTLTQRWRLVQSLKKHIWSAWCTEYLTRLQQRYKWATQTDNLTIGTMVLIKEENINPNQWPLARIVETHQGQDGSVRVVTVKKAGGAIQKRPIHKLIPLPTDETNNSTPIKKQPEDRKTDRTQTTRASTSKSHLLVVLAIIFMIISTAAGDNGFKISYPQHGVYVEHLGSARVDRGVFRIETSHSRNKTKTDIAKVSTVVSQFSDLCEQSKRLTKEVKCASLVQHLEELVNHSKWIVETLDDVHHRSKRGLFGKFLTAVFGVNDDVYQDIDKLNTNQEELIRASNHQTKFMVSTLTTLNATESRITSKLQHFQKRLNQGIDAINTMQTWYKVIDTNTLNIHILSAYQVATNFISDTNDYYEKLLNVCFNRGTIYDIMSPAVINTIIQNSNQKLPSSLKIISTALSTRLAINTTHFNVQGHFPIVDGTEFTLVKATPIPLKIENGAYWTLDLSDDYTAVDYNTQLYFQLQESEFQRCIHLHPHKFICSPVSIRSIESNPSCVINEIYERPQPRHCNIQQHRTNGILWKQLCTTNTWMFIANSSTTVAIICNGVREDVVLNTTGIIQISQECIIQTKQNILTPKRSEVVPVLGSYSKAVPIIFNGTISNHETPHLATEPVLRQTDGFGELIKEEKDFKDLLHDTVWRSIHHHTAAISSITTIAILIIVVLGWHTVKLIIRKRQKRRNLKADKQQGQNEDIELMSLRSSILERRQNV